MNATSFLFPKNLELIINRYLRPAAISCFKSRNIVFSEYDIEEVVSEATCRLLENIGRYDAAKSTSSWFSRICHNCACDYIGRECLWRLRHQSIETVTRDGEVYEHELPVAEDAGCAAADNLVISGEQVAAIERAVENVGGKGAIVLKMKAADHTNEDICKALGMTDGACRVLISRARHQLKKDAEVQRIYAELISYKVA